MCFSILFNANDYINLFYINNILELGNLTSSKFQTKSWRKKQDWYSSGKHNECEKYQESIIIKFGLQINKLAGNNFRLDLHMNVLVSTDKLKKEISNWNDNSFEYSENFDYLLETKNYIYLFNLKFICDDGGFQIRSLKEVYHFINSQYKCKCLIKNKKVFFINILDGNFCFRNMNKLNYLKDKHQKKHNVYIGDMYDFIRNYKVVTS